MEPYQVLPLQARVDLGAMAMKGYSAFLKAPALLEPDYEIISCHTQYTHLRGVLPLCRKTVGVFYRLPRLVGKTPYHIYQPLRSGRTWHKVNFLSKV